MFDGNEMIKILDGRMKSRIVTARSFYENFGLITYLESTDDVMRVKSANLCPNAPRVSIVFSNGRTLVTSSNHRFLGANGKPIYVKAAKEVRTASGVLKIISKKQLPNADVYMPKTSEGGFYKDQFGLLHFTEKED